MAKKALGGAKVLEFAQMVSGPYCGKLLADLGAEVIKIEPPIWGDPSRRKGPFPQDVPHPEKSGLFLYLNTNKQSITLDIDTPTGRQIFLKLVEWADILIEDQRPIEMQEKGLDYASLEKVNPRLIVTSITPFGQTGPYANYRAHNLNAFHASGEGYTTPGGSPNLDREPVKSGSYVSDFDCGLNAAVATLAARFAQLTQGIGQHVDVSKQESLAALYRIDLAKYPNEGSFNTRASQIAFLGGLMPCKDGYVVITAAQDHQWNALMDFLGNPAWSLDECAKDEDTRGKNAEVLQPLLERAVLEYPKLDLYHGAQAKGCPIGMVMNAEEIVNSPQMQARDFFVDVEHPVAGTFKYPAAAYKFSETPPTLERAPLMGEHNEVILCDRLGYSKQDLVRFHQAHII